MNAVDRLSKAVTFATVSDSDPGKVDWEQFSGFHAYLKEAYPLLHKTLHREVVGRASLLYHWKGKGKGKPFAFLAHMDVVPVTPETVHEWGYPPFSGHNDGEYIWGRGSADMKAQLISYLETIETLISEGFTPNQDIYLCFGHNEEILAEQDSGALAMADTLKSRGVELEFVFDEAGAILKDPPFGVKHTVVMVGTAEKGFADLRITLKGEDGHSAEPGGLCAMGDLAKLICAIEANPMPCRLIPCVRQYVSGLVQTLDDVAEQERIAGSDEYVFEKMKHGKKTHAMVRTTIVPTVCRAGSASNVIPAEASCILNVRLLPGDGLEDVEAHIHRLAQQAGIACELRLEVLKHSPPPPETSTDTPTFRLLGEIYSQWEPGSVLVPYIVTGGTDSKNYKGITDEIYRVSPFIREPGRPSGAHGLNEHIPIAAFHKALRFIRIFIEQQSKRYE